MSRKKSSESACKNTSQSYLGALKGKLKSNNAGVHASRSGFLPRMARAQNKSLQHSLATEEFEKFRFSLLCELSCNLDIGRRRALFPALLFATHAARPAFMRVRRSLAPGAGIL
jgi:hypothetical protein